MYTFRNDKRDEDLSALYDGELSAPRRDEVERRIREDAPSKQTYARIAALHTALSEAVPEETVQSAQRRVRERVQTTLTRRVASPWWERSVSLPVPVVAAASVLFLVMTVGLILNPGVLSNRVYTAADLAEQRSVNVQVQMNGGEGDRLMQWLEEQNQVGNVTIQLPDHAEFQLRGEPVLMRPPYDQNDESESFDIVPMEVPAE